MTRTTLSFALLTMIALSSTATAASISEVKFSDWDTTHAEFRGCKSDVSLTLDGCSGYYRIHGCRGRLSDVTYDRLRCGSVEVEGRWHSDGECGWFCFKVTPCGTEFHGDWGYDRGCSHGYWEGDLCRRSHYQPRPSFEEPYRRGSSYSSSGRSCSSRSSCH